MEEKYKDVCTIKLKNYSDDFESRKVLYQNEFENSEVHLVSPKGQSNRYCAKIFYKTAWNYLIQTNEFTINAELSEKNGGAKLFLGIKDIYWDKLNRMIAVVYKNNAISDDLNDANILRMDEDEECCFEAEKKVAKLFKQVAEGLKVIHAKNYIHSDIKPANILKSKRGNTYIIDFGSTFRAPPSQLDDSDPSVAQRNIFRYIGGTKIYMSPQHYQYQRALSENLNPELQLGRETDYWSFGLTIIEVFLGTEVAFQGGQNVFQLQENGLTSDYFKNEKWKRVSDQFIDLVCVLLEYDARKRKALTMTFDRHNKQRLSSNISGDKWFNKRKILKIKNQSERAKNPVYTIFVSHKTSGGLGRPSDKKSMVLWANTTDELERKVVVQGFKTNASIQFNLSEANNPRDGYEGVNSRSIDCNKSTPTDFIKCLVVNYNDA